MRFIYKYAQNQFFCLFVLLLWTDFSFSQNRQSSSISTEEYSFIPFELPGGKVENVLQCVAQDSSGVLWFGTQNGLVSYDGRKFNRFFHNPLDSNSLISSYVECIHVDPNGILWIGSFEYGFTRFDPIRQHFKQFYLKGGEGENQPFIGVNTIQYYQGHLWLGTHNGLLRYAPKSNDFKRYYAKPSYKDIFNSNMVRALYVDRSNTLWMGIGFTWGLDPTNGGLYKYIPEKDQFIEYRHDPNDPFSLSDNRVKGIFEDSKNNFWVGTMGDGLNKLDRKSGQFTSFPYQPQHPERLSRPLVMEIKYRDNVYNQVQFIHEDQDNRLWIGSFDNGLNIYDPIGDRQIHFERGINGLETNNIWNIFQTNDNVLFICSGGDGQGKNYTVKIQRNLFPFYPVSSSFSIMEITRDNQHKIWLGITNSKELWQFDTQNSTSRLLSSSEKENVFSEEIRANKQIVAKVPTGLFREFIIQKYWNRSDRSTASEEKPISQHFLQASKKDTKGNIWIGTWGEGLFKINPQNKTIQHYLFDSNNASGIGGNHISDIFEDQANNIWIGGGKETKNPNHPFFLDRLDLEADTFIHYYPESQDYGYPSMIQQDQKGHLWFPTTLEGIHRLDVATRKITKYNKTNSLIPSDEIRALVIDEEDNIWMSTEKTLVRFTPDRLSFVEYSKEQGIKIDKFEFSSAYISPEQRIYFGGLGGFHAFDPKEVLKKEILLPPSILISELKVKNEEGTVIPKLLPSQSTSP